jgi:hypothetical protein
VIAPAALAAILLALAAVLAACSSGDRGNSRSGPEAPRAGPEALVVTSVRLLGLRVPDPRGGPPWGMRLVTTTRGLLCAQVGRVMHGELGQLGLDGAFHDDGRFHAMAPDDLPEVLAQGVAGDNTDCLAPKETFAGEIDGLDRNALANPQGDTIALSGRREISYGLLGPHALAVTYKHGSTTLARPVLRGLGAYLIVLQARRNRYLGSTGAAPGSDYADDLDPAGPAGALVAITYRYGRTVCRDDGNEPITRCGLPGHPLGPEGTPSQRGG